MSWGSTTILVDTEGGLYSFVAKIQEAHTNEKWTFFMARVNIATFSRELMERAGIKICLYLHGISIRVRCLLYSQEYCKLSHYQRPSGTSLTTRDQITRHIWLESAPVAVHYYSRYELRVA